MKTPPPDSASDRAGNREVVFAILAHDSAACLTEQLDILKCFAPTSECIVFDASPCTRLTAEVGIVPCPGSQPLVYGHLAPFHVAAMRAAAELGNYDFLITLDSDMLLCRPGIVDYLRQVMRDAEYMAPHFRKVSWLLRADSHRRFLYCWKPYWKNFLGASRPYRVLNCFQVFRKELVSRFLAHSRIDEVIDATMPGHTALVALEEIVYPTLAVSLGANSIAYPGSYSIHTGPLTMAELAAFKNDANVILVHTGVRDVASPVWQFVRALSLGAEYEPPHDERRLNHRTMKDRARSLIDRAIGDVKVLSAVAKGARY